MKIKYLILSVIACSSFGLMKAQDAAGNEVAMPKTLFQYVQVPDTIKLFENRANYFVQNFWRNFDFSKPITDEELFQGAFTDWLTFFPHADRNIVVGSVNDVMNKAQSNMPNFWKFVDAAETYMYAPDAELMSDEGYAMFISNVVKSTKVKKAEKERYLQQLKKINSNLIGHPAAELKFTDAEGRKRMLSEISAPTVILFFNDPECSDCSIARLRLSTSVGLNEMIDSGKVAVVSIYPGKYSGKWAEEAKNYPKNWINGATDSAEEIYDIRLQPTIYILDGPEKIIAMKFADVNQILRAVEN